MHIGRFGDRFMLRIDPGEELVDRIHEFARLTGVNLATVSGIGAADRVELMYWIAGERRYDLRVFEAEVELLSIAGNLTLKEDRPFAHLHAVIAGPDYRAYGGHLKAARVSVTCELVVEPIPGTVRRVLDGKTGLSLMTFEG